MDKFDQWYNKKMDEQEIVYSDNSWESFSQQLEKLPAKNKRRFPLFFWWVLGLSFIIEGGVLWYFLSSNELKKETRINSGDKSEDNQIKIIERDEKVPQNFSNQPLAGMQKKSEIDKVSQSNSDVAQNNRLQSDIRSEKILKSPIASEASSDNTVETNSVNKQSLVLAQVSENQSNTVQKKHSEDKEIVKAKSYSELAENLNVAELSFNKAGKPGFADNGFEAVPLLDTEIRPIVMSSAIVLPVTQLPEEELVSIKPDPVKIWTHHAEIGAQFFPGIKEGSRFLTGLSAAYHLQYRWAQRWSVSLGIGALQRWGSFGGFEDSPQDRYASTKIRRGYLLVPTAATYMQIPLLVNFQQGRHVFSAGVRSMILMGVKGQLDEYSVQRDAQHESLVVNTSTVNTGWINESGFRSIVPEYMLAYGFQFNKHLSASVSLGWMPNGIVYAENGNDFADVVFNSAALDSNNSQQPFLLENKWQLGLGLKYKF